MSRGCFVACARLLAALLLNAAALADDGARDEIGGPFENAIRSARERVVKIYGAGIGREHGYASGVVISADGRIVTALAVLLEGAELRVVLADGSKRNATVLARDERRQLALLKIEASELPYFPLGDSSHLQIGDWLIAAANPFKVAVGSEPVSAAAGVLAGRTNLDARRRAQDFSYTGPILLTDVLVSGPGSAGGALVDLDGRLVGVIGKPVISNRTNTWMNYALPVEEVAAFVKDYEAEQAGGAVASQDRPIPASGPSAADAPGNAAAGGTPDLGIQLFSIGGRSKAAYVERVRGGSPAREAGLRANDLVLSIDGRNIASCEDYDAVFRGLRPGQTIEMVVKRGEALVTVKIVVSRRAP